MDRQESSYGLGLSNAWGDERRRLASAQATYDPATFRHLDELGIGAGMRCLEVGGGGGSIAAFMAARVGPTGSVVVTDLDLGLLDGCDLPNVEACVHDICADPIDGDFDIIHARLVLENVPDRLTVLKKLVAALRPGGWILIEDFDNTALMELPVSRQLFRPRRLGSVCRRTARIAQTMAATVGIDMQFGRDLPGHLLDVGLAGVDAEVSSRLVLGGSERADYLALSMQTVGSRLIATGAVSQRDLDAAVAALGQPDSVMMSLPMVSAWGRCPS